MAGLRDIDCNPIRSLAATARHEKGFATGFSYMSEVLKVKRRVRPSSEIQVENVHLVETPEEENQVYSFTTYHLD